jgi:hypothetical protein
MSPLNVPTGQVAVVLAATSIRIECVSPLTPGEPSTYKVTVVSDTLTPTGLSRSQLAVHVPVGNVTSPE